MIYTVVVVCEPPLLPVYSEQMPKVKVCERASLKPTRLSRSVMTIIEVSGHDLPLWNDFDGGRQVTVGCMLF